MKWIIAATALAISGTAMAQDTTPTGGQTMTPPTTQTDPNAPTPGSTTPDSTSMPDSTGTTAPGTPGAMSTTGTGAPTVQMGPMVDNPPPAAPASYPRCSKTVKDGCIQRGGK